MDAGLCIAGYEREVRARGADRIPSPPAQSPESQTFSWVT